MDERITPWTLAFHDRALEDQFRRSETEKMRRTSLIAISVVILASLLFLLVDRALPPDIRPLAITLRLAMVGMLLAMMAAVHISADYRILDRVMLAAFVMAYAGFLVRMGLYPQNTAMGGAIAAVTACGGAVAWMGPFAWGVVVITGFALGRAAIAWPSDGANIDAMHVAVFVLLAALLSLFIAARFQYGARRDFLLLLRERRLAAELDEKRREAEAAGRAKAEFLAVMSHEIRTPMNGVLGLTALVLDTPLSPDQRDKIETVHHSAEALLAILDDVLDFSKLEAGRLTFERIPFELRRSVESAVRLMDSRAGQKGLVLDCVIDPAVPNMVEGDSIRLRQVLLNLVGNAVKFTPGGRVTVRVRPRPAATGMVGLRFEVEDTGIGLDDEAKSRLFQSFVQADSSISRRFGGTGLGLAICRKLVEGQGGTIGCDSTPGQGSTFWFELDFAPAHAPAGHLARQAAKLPALDVLLAEDNPVNQQVAAGFLTRDGHRVTIANDGAEAVRLAAERHFDIVLMDMQMPGMDGLEAATRIRALPAPASGLPIVALTANAMAGDKERCRAAGMDAHVAKPISPAALAAAMAEALAGHSGATVEPLDTDVLDELQKVLGAEALADLVRLFVENSEATCQAIQAAGTNLGEIRALAHDLKGMASYLGNIALANLAAAMEEAARDGHGDVVERLTADLPGEWEGAKRALADRLPMEAAG